MRRHQGVTPQKMLESDKDRERLGNNDLLKMEARWQDIPEAKMTQMARMLYLKFRDLEE